MPGSPANIEVSSKNQMINHTGSNIWNKSVNSVASIKTLKIEKKLDWSWKERKKESKQNGERIEIFGQRVSKKIFFSEQMANPGSKFLE